MWPATGARNRLRMKTPVCRIAIFRSAVAVQRPFGHRRVAAIVRQAFNHRVAWPAIGAIYIWIVIAPILRGEHFAKAILTNRQISRYTNSRSALPLAGKNQKFFAYSGLGGHYPYSHNGRSR